jgi:hypothetical protein
MYTAGMALSLKSVARSHLNTQGIALPKQDSLSLPLFQSVLPQILNLLQLLVKDSNDGVDKMEFVRQVSEFLLQAREIVKLRCIS